MDTTKMTEEERERKRQEIIKHNSLMSHIARIYIRYKRAVEEVQLDRSNAYANGFVGGAGWFFEHILPELGISRDEIEKEAIAEAGTREYYNSEEYYNEMYDEYLRALEIYDDDYVREYLAYEIQALRERGYEVW